MKRIVTYIRIASLFTNVLMFLYIDYKNERAHKQEIEMYNMFFWKYSMFANHLISVVNDVNHEVLFNRARDHMTI